MARLNIEDRWWTDPRRSRLTKLLGSEHLADGIVIKAWRLAQDYWKFGKGLIPRDIFESIEGCEFLVECRLAVVRESEVYIRGSNDHLDWVREKIEQASKAGKRSAEIRKAKNGTAQPKKLEPNSNEARTESNEPEPSDSLSGSSSRELVRENVILNFENQYSPLKPDFEKLTEKLFKEFNGTVPRNVRQNAAKIITHFGDVEAYRTWVNEILGDDKAINKIEKPNRFFATILLREIGAIS